jgi:type II secretory pathway component PulC
MNSKRMLVLGNLVITALVFWMAASIVLTWVSQKRSEDFLKGGASRPPSSREAVPRQNKTLADYAVISEKDVFRSTKGTSQGAGTEEADIKVTELNLELKGTVVGEGRSSYAVIVDHDSGKEDVYFQDDFVLGARITGITRSKVILDRNGKEEALLMTAESRALPEIGASPQTRPTPKPRVPPRRVVTPGRSVRAPGQ